MGMNHQIGNMTEEQCYFDSQDTIWSHPQRQADCG